MKKFLLIGVIGAWFLFQNFSSIMRIWHSIPGLSEQPVYIFKTNSSNPLPANFPFPAEQSFMFKKCDPESPRPVEEPRAEHRKGGVRITESVDLWKDPVLRVVL
jgi:hypothetical protein